MACCQCPNIGRAQSIFNELIIEQLMKEVHGCYIPKVQVPLKEVCKGNVTNAGKVREDQRDKGQENHCLQSTIGPPNSYSNFCFVLIVEFGDEDGSLYNRVLLTRVDWILEGYEFVFVNAEAL